MGETKDTYQRPLHQRSLLSFPASFHLVREAVRRVSYKDLAGNEGEDGLWVCRWMDGVGLRKDA